MQATRAVISCFTTHDKLLLVIADDGTKPCRNRAELFAAYLSPLFQISNRPSAFRRRHSHSIVAGGLLLIS